MNANNYRSDTQESGKPIQAIITAAHGLHVLTFIPVAGAACMMAYAVWITFKRR